MRQLILIEKGYAPFKIGFGGSLTRADAAGAGGDSGAFDAASGGASDLGFRSNTWTDGFSNRNPPSITPPSLPVFHDERCVSSPRRQILGHGEHLTHNLPRSVLPER